MMTTCPPTVQLLSCPPQPSLVCNNYSSIYLSYLSIYSSIYLFIYLSIHLSIYTSIYHIYLSYLSIYLYIYLSIHLIHPSFHQSIIHLFMHLPYIHTYHCCCCSRWHHSPCIHHLSGMLPICLPGCLRYRGRLCGVRRTRLPRYLRIEL